MCNGEVHGQPTPPAQTVIAFAHRLLMTDRTLHHEAPVTPGAPHLKHAGETGRQHGPKVFKAHRGHDVFRRARFFRVRLDLAFWHAHDLVLSTSAKPARSASGSSPLLRA